MKIGNINSTSSITAIGGDRPSATSDSQDSSPVTMTITQQSSTQVELSPAATMLAAASADPSFDSEKVERIAQAIRDGKFSIDPGAIADKLISNSQELLSSSQTLN